MKFPNRILVVLLTLLYAAGCSPATEKPLSSSEADKKFIQILRNDYGLAPVLFYQGETLWIYLPDENRELYKITAGPASAAPSTPKKFALEYIKGVFKEKIFEFEYDVITPTKVSSGSGLANQYSPEFSTQNRNVLTAIARTFFDAEKSPEFIVIVFADVKNGMEAAQTFHVPDLKRYYSYGMPPDEYSMRVLTEANGSQKIIGDFEGKHLRPKPVSWTEFLQKQIEQRVRYKFQSSDFPPNETPATEILKIIAATLNIYDFKKYDAVNLIDLRTANARSFTRGQIENLQNTLNLGQEKPAPEGKIITVDFSNLGKENSKGILSTKPTNEETPKVTVDIQPENPPAEK